VAEVESEPPTMIDQSAVSAAERAVASRKATLASQWTSLRTRLRDGVTEPATLGAAALVGGIAGWRSAAPQATVEVKCNCADKPRASLLGSGLRTLAIATLQAVASVASEEFVRSSMEQTSREGAVDFDGTNGS
jgi:hypothetical protein